MSNPQNPLNNYRTSSYYFVLSVTNNLDTAEQIFVNSSEIPTANKDVQSAETRLKDDFGSTTTTTGSYKTLINGATDTKLIIKSVNFRSALNPNEEHKGESYYHTFNLDGEITIQEPMGISFYNTLATASNDLETSAVGLIFVLKPYFVGHLPSGQTETYSNVKPYLFIITNMTSVIDEGGATYELNTMGLVNGAAKLPQYQSVSEGFNMELGADKTLVQAFEELKTNLDSYAADRKEQMGGKMDEEGMSRDVLLAQHGVEYEFHLDEKYKDEKFLVASNASPRFMEIKDKGKYFLSQGPSAGIEDIIKKLMNSCKEVIEERGTVESTNEETGETTEQSKTDADLATGGAKSNGEKTFIFKVASATEIKPDTFTIHYYIQRYEVTFESLDETGNVVQHNTDKKLEFDYIYTGKNIDIREFNMKMTLGIGFFHVTGTSNSLANFSVTDEEPGVNSSNTGSGIIIGPKGKQLVPGTLSTGGANKSPESRNVRYPISTGAYYSLLKKWAAIESALVNMVIRGNPQLMDETTFVPSDLGLNKPQTSGGDTLFSENGALSSPLFIKVNVKFPKDYSNPRSDFETFWYDGVYFVSTIKNVFENGEFYQEIEMHAIKTDVFNDTKVKDESTLTSPIVNLAYGKSEGDISGVSDAARKSTETFNFSEDITSNLPSLSLPGGVTPFSVKQKVERMRELQFQFGVKQLVVEKQMNSFTNKINQTKTTASSNSFNLESLGISEAGISALKSELETYQGYMDTVNSKLGDASKLQESLGGILNQKSTVGMLQAANAEFKILERLNVSPNNIVNIIKKEAPILSDTWESVESQYSAIKGQYDQIRSQYGELKSMYSELDSLVKSIGNIT